jgi:putative tricarboxylic transport membrane protein
MIRSFLNSDQVCGVIWFLIGLSMCIGSFKLSLGEIHNPGPGFMPFLTGAVLALLGLVLILLAIVRKLRREEGGEGKEIFFVRENRKRFLISTATLLGYTVLFEPIGYLLSTFIFFYIMIKLMTPKGWLMPLVLSGSATILGYLVFTVWLKAQFPKGILDF